MQHLHIYSQAKTAVNMRRKLHSNSSSGSVNGTHNLVKCWGSIAVRAAGKEQGLNHRDPSSPLHTSCNGFPPHYLSSIHLSASSALNHWPAGMKGQKRDGYRPGENERAKKRAEDWGGKFQRGQNKSRAQKTNSVLQTIKHKTVLWYLCLHNFSIKTVKGTVEPDVTVVLLLTQNKNKYLSVQSEKH